MPPHALAAQIDPTKRPGKAVTIHSLRASSSLGIGSIAKCYSQQIMMELFLDEQHAVTNPDRILLVSSAFATQDDEHVGKNQGIVYEFDGKVGSTMHLLNRRKYYALLFLRGLPLAQDQAQHDLPLVTDERAKAIVCSFFQAVIDSSLPKPIKDFFSVIRHQHGGKLGLNR